MLKPPIGNDYYNDRNKRVKRDQIEALDTLAGTADTLARTAAS